MLLVGDMPAMVVLIVLAVLSVLLVVWFGTARLQRPPQYPAAQIDIRKYFDEYRMDYSVAKSGLIDDVDALVASTEELHVDPYRMTSREAFLKKAQQVKSHIETVEPEEISVQDAFYDLQELAVFMQDGHTTLYPHNWRKAVDSVFPLTFTSIEGRIFVTHNYGENDAPERAELLAVNGVSIDQMTHDAMKYVPGTLPHLKQARFAEQLGLFIQTRHKMPSPWQVTYRDNGTIATAMIEGVTQDSLEKATTLQPEYGESKIEVDGKTVPVLDLAFSGFGDSEWADFKAFIDDFVARNKDEAYLIIDARHHLGGEGAWGVYVLSHLTPALRGFKEFSFKVSPLHQQIVRYAFESAYYDMKLPRFLWGFPLYKLVQRNDPYYWIGRGILESDPGAFYHAKWEDYKSYLADSGRFHGKAFLLVSHETFSAGTYFAGLFGANNLGPIVGRETGGRVYMESDMRPVLLPNSNLMYMIPVARFVVCDGNPDRGIIPDIAVDLTSEDYVSHRDKDVEQVIDLIRADLTANPHL